MKSSQLLTQVQARLAFTAASKYNVGDVVRISVYDENGRLPAQNPKATVVKLPTGGNKRYVVKKADGTIVEVGLGQMS